MYLATENQNIPIIILAGTLGMLILAIAIILFVVAYQKKVIRQQAAMQALKTAHQKSLLQSIINTQEKERNRIAQDLHDDVGAMLSAIKLSVNLLHRKAPAESDIKHQANDTKQMIDEAIGSVRRISKELLPATLNEFGLVDALDELTSKLAKTTGVKIAFDHNGENIRYESPLELALFRITQELINNSLKHAQAKHLNVSFTNSAKHIELVVEDDGVGFDYEAVKKRAGKDQGLGLRNIESRLSIVEHPVIDIDSNSGKGTSIKIKLDLVNFN